jgi:flagellar protein FliO/FliZ
LPDERSLVFEGGGGAAVAPDAEAEAVGAFGVWDLLRMVLVLLLVIGAVYAVISLLRRRMPGEAEEEESPIRVLASRNLGNNRDIHAVMVGKQVWILGGGDAGVSLISTVEDQETIDELVLAHSAAVPGTRPTFGAALGRWFGNLAVPGSGSRSATSAGTAGGGSVQTPAGAGFVRAYHDRLRHMR